MPRLWPAEHREQEGGDCNGSAAVLEEVWHAPPGQDLGWGVWPGVLLWGASDSRGDARPELSSVLEATSTFSSELWSQRVSDQQATLTYDTLRFAEFEDFPETSEPVWILGRKYSIFTEKDEILADVASRLWFTYRKNFPAIGVWEPLLCARPSQCAPPVLLPPVHVAPAPWPVVTFLVCGEGGTGPTSDAGWGCMLRCGQMIFAQALVCRHLGRDWRWTQRKRQPDSYFSVLNAFVDRKDSYYSIHQIGTAWCGIHQGHLVILEVGPLGPGAQMGVGEGKSVGQWYGPNTVAQVLKKLAVFDTWSALAVHIAMDNTVVMEDIREELIYLDPHTTQPAVQVTDSCLIPDESFHCQHPPSRMNISELDPSIAVGFFCKTEDDFNDWCQQVKKLSLLGGALPMFELVEQQPSHLACPDVLNLSLGPVPVAFDL
ncbi:hypothetical protein CB1_000575013 [Camelus ferus]|nr:hypothetical protein CB1_000575013 [Camelus ferus]